MTIGFVGGGNMAEAIIAGMLQGSYNKDDLLAYDIREDRCAYLSSRYGIGTPEPEELFRRSDAIVLAVKPQMMEEVLLSYGAYLQSEHLIISIAAGITTTRLKGMVPGRKIVRVMPNTPSLVGLGMAALCSLDHASLRDDEITAVEGIFGSVGHWHWLDESLFDAVTAISGSGPAYLYRYATAMIEGGIELGLSPDLARELVTETILGSVEMIRRTTESPKTLEEKVTSPGGTTFHGLKAMEEGDFSQSIKNGIRAAYARSIEMGKEKK